VRQVLVDVNVILDAVLDRAPHGAAAATLWGAVEEKRVGALVPAHGVTTLFYLVRQGKGAAAARRAVDSVLSVFRVAPVDEGVLRRALALGWGDFEDAVCAAAAEAAGCDVVVTRDPAGFRGSPVPVVDPTTAVSLVPDGQGPAGVAEGRPRYGRAGKRARSAGRRGE
jgi:predicted nucleic acid-binding protein